MASITLKEGDFGSDITVIVGEAVLYLPDRSRPGLNAPVPLTEIAEIEVLSDDRSGQLKQAARLGARGFLATGNPLGLAASVFAVTKVKDVEFAVRLKDGRRFVATANAGTYADLSAGSRVARPLADSEDAEAAARADAVIAKYLGAGAQSPDRQPDDAPAPAAASGPADEAPSSPAPTEKRVFGRRRPRES